MKKCRHLVAIFCNSNSHSCVQFRRESEEMRILDGEAGAFQSQPESLMLGYSERKDHQDLAPLALLTGVGTGDSHPNFPGHFQRNKEGQRTPWEPHWKKSLFWSKMTPFQESEGWSLGSQSLAKTLCFSGGILKPPVFEDSDEKEPGLKPSSTLSLRVLRMTSVQPKGLVGPETPLSPGTGGASHGHPTGPARSQLAGYRPSSGTWPAKHLVPFCVANISAIILCTTTFVLKTSNLSLLSFVVCAFGSRSKKSRANSRSWTFSLLFSSMGCV